MIFAAGVLHHVNMLEVVRHPWFVSAVSGFVGAQILKLAISTSPVSKFASDTSAAKSSSGRFSASSSRWSSAASGISGNKRKEAERT